MLVVFLRIRSDPGLIIAGHVGSFVSESMTSEALNALISSAGRDRSRIATWYALMLM